MRLFFLPEIYHYTYYKPINCGLFVSRLGIEKNDTKMDASTIGKVFTITNLEKRFKENALKVLEEAAINIKAENERLGRRGIRF